MNENEARPRIQPISIPTNEADNTRLLVDIYAAVQLLEINIPRIADKLRDAIYRSMVLKPVLALDMKAVWIKAPLLKGNSVVFKMIRCYYNHYHRGQISETENDGIWGVTAEESGLDDLFHQVYAERGVGR